MKAAKLVPPLNKAKWPRCRHKVRVGVERTRRYKVREQRSKQLGLALDDCGNYATHLIDGEPYCAAHAGQVALRELLK